jgi:hypothetical protein
MECPVCFSSEILGRRDKERDHGPCAYCNSFSCLALTLAGAGPGATPCNPPSEYAFKPGDKLGSANRAARIFGAPKGSKGLISILQSNGYAEFLVRTSEQSEAHFGKMPPLQEGVNANIHDVYSNLDRI